MPVSIKIETEGSLPGFQSLIFIEFVTKSKEAISMCHLLMILFNILLVLEKKHIILSNTV